MTGATAVAVQEAMERYFARERTHGVLFLVCAAAAGAFSAGLIAVRSPYRAMVWPLVLIGLVQLVVGASLFLRTPRQGARLADLLHSSPAAFKTQETARLRRVQRRFVLYKRIEIGLLALGLAFASIEGYGRTLYAVGMGLMLEAGLMLALDLVAERRGQRYLDAVQALAP